MYSVWKEVQSCRVCEEAYTQQVSRKGKIRLILLISQDVAQQDPFPLVFLISPRKLGATLIHLG